nr:putative odorant receptor 71a [Megalopta genalis]
MHKLPLSFLLLTCVGYWRPTTWPANSLKYWLYNAYSLIMIFLLYLFTFYAFVDAIISKDLNTTTDKFSLCISVLGVCMKVANLFIQRKRIVSVVNSLLKKIHVPRDEEEMIIQRKFDNHARKLTLYCEVLNESAASVGTVGQLNQLISTRTLPISNWAPYDLSSPTIYAASWIQQTLSLLVCANTSVAHETLISGLMIQISAQFEIFCHRARSLPALLTEAERLSQSAADLKIRRKKILKNLIEHQLGIYKFAHNVNTVFQYMILLQLMVSSMVLCLTIYKMSTAHSLDVNFAWSLSYLCSMLMQVYLYCWYGNEVTLKSTKVCDAIYQMDWTSLPVSIVKDLLMIMMRSRKPVKMSSAQVITLSTESFVTVS